MHGFGNQGLQEVTMPIITSSDPFGKFVFPIPTTVGSVGLQVVVIPRGPH